MTEIQNKFRIHRSPTANSGSCGKKVPLAQINAPDFDFKAQFQPDLLVKKSDWWVVKKSQPWAICDCMIIDTGERQRSSFAEFSQDELCSLFNLAEKIAGVLKRRGVKKIIIGANINHEIESTNLDKVLLRLHLHVLGFSDDELSKMEEITFEELEKENPAIENYLFDPMLEKFKEKILPILGSGSAKSSLGISVNLAGDLNAITKRDFCDEVRKVDREIAKQFPALSYSFCLDCSDKIALTLSPCSVFGKGVLEAIGIILKRDDGVGISPEDQTKREEFFEKVRKEIL